MILRISPLVFRADFSLKKCYRKVRKNLEIMKKVVPLHSL